jgi:hypothetical protein
MSVKHLFFIAGWEKERSESHIKKISQGQASDLEVHNFLLRSHIEISEEAVLSASQLYTSCVRAGFKESERVIKRLSCEKLNQNHRPLNFMGLDEEKLKALRERGEKERSEFFNNEKICLHRSIFFKNLNIARELLLKGEEVFATILLKEMGFKKKEVAQCIKILGYIRVI